jgi:hypothetical protein
MIKLSRLAGQPRRWEGAINDAGRHERRLMVGGELVALIERLPGRRFRLVNLIDGETTDDFESSLEAKQEIEFDIEQRLADLAKRKLAIWK